MQEAGVAREAQACQRETLPEREAGKPARTGGVSDRGKVQKIYPTRKERQDKWQEVKNIGAEEG